MRKAGPIGLAFLIALTPHIVAAQDGAGEDWRVVSTFAPAAGLRHEAGARFARQAAATTGLNVRFLGPGQAIDPVQVFSAVERGAVEAIWSAATTAADAWQWGHASPAFTLLAAAPFGLGPRDLATWLLDGEGALLQSELFGRHGLVALTCAVPGPEGDFWSRRPVASIRTLRGMTIRPSGTMPRAVLEQAGARLKALPGGEVAPALGAGSIDAARFGDPVSDLNAGLHQAASRYYYPGVLAPATALTLFVNAAAWGRLTPGARAALGAACAENVTFWLAESETRARQALIQLTTEHGVSITPLPPEVTSSLRQAWDVVARRAARRNPDFARVHAAIGRALLGESPAELSTAGAPDQD